MSSSPPLEILVREPESFSIWTGPPFSSGQPSLRLERIPCTSTRFSENGSKLMVMNSNFSIYDCQSSTKMRSFEIPSVLAATLSPCGTFLQTFQKAPTPQEKNLILWEIASGNPVYHQFQKNMLKTTWPSIQFSADEAIACRLATNEI